jgi:hypothetical protein
MLRIPGRWSISIWGRDHISRSTLLPKPVRVVSGAEAIVLGGRGEFELMAVRPPAEASAWTEVAVVPRGPGDDAVLVLEVGGEISTVAQVLASVFLAPAGGRVERLSLVPRAPGLPVIRVARGLPISSTEWSDPHGADGSRSWWRGVRSRSSWCHDALGAGRPRVGLDRGLAGR